MVAYAFEKRHHPALLDGSKPFTMRAVSKKRHARIGEEVQLRDGRSGPVFARASCTYRALATFDETGLIRVHCVCYTPAGEPLNRLFLAAEQGAPQAAEHREKLARADGFDDWAAMAAWHRQTGGEKAGTPMTREVIGVFGVVAEPKAA